MKSFKSFILENKEEEEKKHSIPHPIHFKHIPSEEHDKKHETPHPIHFKYIPSKEKEKKLEEGIFNWFKSKPKKSSPPISNFLNENLNSELGSNPKEITKKLHSDQSQIDSSSKNALKKYSGDGSYEMNHHLIASGGIVHKDHESIADGIDQAIQKNKIKRELHTYSGVKFDPRSLLNKDGRMRSSAYISSTHDPKIAYDFASVKPGTVKHIIHFHLKPDDPAVHVGDHSIYKSEHETIIGRGAVLQHHGSTEYEDKVGIKYIVHHMTVHRTPEQNSLYSKIKKGN